MTTGCMVRQRRTWPGTWTWAMPMALNWRITTRDGRTLTSHRRRLVDYAVEPDPTLPAEVLRRGFLESA